VPERAALEALDALVRRRMLREEDEEGWYTFGCDVIQDVVSSQAGTARRHLAQRRALAVLEELGMPTTDLVERALTMGLREEGISYSVAAGDAALARRAVRDAITHYERARTLVEAVEPARPTSVPGERLAQLYLGLGQAYECAEDVLQARMDYQAARTVAQQRNVAWPAALTRLAMLAARAFDRETATALLREARAVAAASRGWEQREETVDWASKVATLLGTGGGRRIHAAAVPWTQAQREPVMAAAWDRPHSGAHAPALRMRERAPADIRHDHRRPAWSGAPPERAAMDSQPAGGQPTMPGPPDQVTARAV
jgi:tetratricopeptide (TPR) repeat protein